MLVKKAKIVEYIKKRQAMLLGSYIVVLLDELSILKNIMTDHS